MKKSITIKGIVNITAVFLNILFLVLAFWLYKQYTDAYDEQLHEENIISVSNLNTSAVMNSTALFESFDIKLKDIEQYIERNELTLDEALDFICSVNSSNDRYFQLVSSDYTGFLAQTDAATGTFIPLDYSENAYKKTGLQTIFSSSEEEFDEIRFAAEFTDSGPTGTKFFAEYRYITIKGEEKPWTLMLAVKAKYIMDILNKQSGYDGQITVLINSTGNYIVNNKYFSSTNLFDYIRERNNLTADERYEMQQQIKSSSKGTLYYNKLNGTQMEPFVFLYEKMMELDISDWYCVTCVPLSSFHTPEFKFYYIIYIILVMMLLFVMDIIWLNALNRRLKVSMMREKEASLAKGNFLSRMSHEIRTPLNAVIGYNTIARNELHAAKSAAEIQQSSASVMSCLEKSEIASRHLLTIINDVLDVSAIESGRIKIAHDKFDFKGLITSLTTVFYSQARSKGISFDVIFCSETSEWFVGDQMRTNQILTNLLSNAVKFTPDGGAVKLKINQTESREKNCTVRFEVSDTGIGMTPEYISHIWTPFEQADSSISRRFGGTGLGLSITKNLVDLMNGKIEIDSVVGKGTTFTVELDFELTEQSTCQAYDFSGINALVADDDSTTCDYIRLLFSRCGAKCACVTSGEDAVNAVSISLKNNTPYSFCIIDWQMPKMDGIETIVKIRELVGNELPITILTAYDFSEIAEKANKIGVTRFISKPLFQSSLFDLLVSMANSNPTNVSLGKKKYMFNGQRLLLAEDNVMNMEIAKKLITSVGFVVDCAQNGREAVEIFKAAEAGTYSAILMDIHMPELNGLDATREIRASTHPDAVKVPIIAMTADAFAENVAEAMAAGMNDHVAKPIDLPTLFDTLEKYV